ncbi:hypothetical protein H2248_007294 [Termitomyces sp. 'cryptogamus']|nr:hypothetical protein H2248_007294 [Termitomyces sp. 'cryptogamus']
MLCEGLSIFQNLLSIFASSLSIRKDLESSPAANHPPSPDLQKEIDDYISSARNTLAEVNTLLAANASVLTGAEFYLHANQSGILGQELHNIQNQRLKGIDADSRSSKAEALHNDAQEKKVESEELRVAVSLVSAIAQKRAHTLKTLEELTAVCGREPTFQRQLDFLSLSEEIINISKSLNTIGRTFEELISPACTFSAQTRVFLRFDCLRSSSIE